MLVSQTFGGFQYRRIPHRCPPRSREIVKWSKADNITHDRMSFRVSQPDES